MNEFMIFIYKFNHGQFSPEAYFHTQILYVSQMFINFVTKSSNNKDNKWFNFYIGVFSSAENEPALTISLFITLESGNFKGYKQILTVRNINY